MLTSRDVVLELSREVSVWQASVREAPGEASGLWAWAACEFSNQEKPSDVGWVWEAVPCRVLGLYFQQIWLPHCMPGRYEGYEWPSREEQHEIITFIITTCINFHRVPAHARRWILDPTRLPSLGVPSKSGWQKLAEQLHVGQECLSVQTLESGLVSALTLPLPSCVTLDSYGTCWRLSTLP